MTEAQILDALRDALGDEPFAGAASLARVEKAEEDLHVQFPPSYRLFLLHFGAAEAHGLSIMGLEDPPPHPNETPSWSDVVLVATQLRRGLHPLPRHLIPVADDGSECKFYLDTGERAPDGECPVRAVGPGLDESIVAKDFLTLMTLASAATARGCHVLDEAERAVERGLAPDKAQS